MFIKKNSLIDLEEISSKVPPGFFINTITKKHFPFIYFYIKACKK